MSDFPAEFWEGVAQFNQRQFYDCHDTLEAIWMEAMEPERTFYQGILQIAVALYHMSNGNGRGATMLLGEGIRRLGRYQPEYGGVDVEDLVSQSAAVLGSLQQDGPECAADLWRSLISPAAPSGAVAGAAAGAADLDSSLPMLPVIHVLG
ncbi:MAG: hypothetical protein Fur0046_24930 [Cyanobacteria bacterium J069]|nr:MAG: DUF309 domain-containing protein [Cyanobacteria bacterium J069]